MKRKDSSDFTLDCSRKRVKTEHIDRRDRRCIALFYADWCQHSRKLRPQWNQLKDDYGDRYDFVEFELDKHPRQMEINDIQGFPTIKLSQASEPFLIQEYQGDRSYDSLKNFLLN